MNTVLIRIVIRILRTAEENSLFYLAYCCFFVKIPDAIVSGKSVNVDFCESIDNALAEILKAEKSGQIRIVRYSEFIAKRENWLYSIIKSEFSEAENHPEYRFFLKEKFAKYLD